MCLDALGWAGKGFSLVSGDLVIIECGVSLGYSTWTVLLIYNTYKTIQNIDIKINTYLIQQSKISLQLIWNTDVFLFED